MSPEDCQLREAPRAGRPDAPPDPSYDSDLREIPKWADRYARHRLLPVLFTGGINMGVAAIIGALSAGAAIAWRDGHIALGLALTIADIGFCAWWLWMAFSKRLNAWTAAGNAWLYRNEGQAAPAASTRQPTRLDKAAGWTFGALVCATPILCTHSGISIRYLQPLTAAYTVPFMVYLCYRQRTCSTPLMLLWPGLYGVHAILVLAGVPLLANLGPLLSVILPMAGYQLVAMLASHAYSRYALRRLKRLVGPGEGTLHRASLRLRDCLRDEIDRDREAVAAEKHAGDAQALACSDNGDGQRATDPRPDWRQPR